MPNKGNPYGPPSLKVIRWFEKQKSVKHNVEDTSKKSIVAKNPDEWWSKVRKSHMKALSVLDFETVLKGAVISAWSAALESTVIKESTLKVELATANNTLRDASKLLLKCFGKLPSDGVTGQLRTDVSKWLATYQHP